MVDLQDLQVAFIVTNLTLPGRAVVRFYNQRGTVVPWIKEGKQAVKKKMTRLSCHRFRANDVYSPPPEGQESIPVQTVTVHLERTPSVQCPSTFLGINAAFHREALRNPDRALSVALWSERASGEPAGCAPPSGESGTWKTNESRTPHAHLLTPRFLAPKFNWDCRAPHLKAG